MSEFIFTPLKVRADKCIFALHDAMKRKTIDLSGAQLTFLLRFASREAGGRGGRGLKASSCSRRP